jgi:hypothetical protein
MLCGANNNSNNITHNILEFYLHLYYNAVIKQVNSLSLTVETTR